MENKIHIHYFESPFGELIIGSFNNKLCVCDWRYRQMRGVIDARIKKYLEAEYIIQESPVVTETIEQLTQYFNGQRSSFTVPLLLTGTNFQKQVWKELQHIPFGVTNTYLELSKKLNNPKAIRAVASANGANAISIIIPCHRIIGSDGKLIGYAGGLPAKKKLLALENPLLKNQLELF